MGTPTDWDNYFILKAEINLAGVTVTPVGNTSTPFTGIFDGNGHAISAVIINTPASNYVGLFGNVGGIGQLKNLGLKNINIAGKQYTGGLVGMNYGTITSCYATGAVSGSTYVGGLTGSTTNGTITSCYATGAVSGSSNVGGLTGGTLGPIVSCYATSNVTGTGDRIGGLVGTNSGPITFCYATGTVSGISYIGGLAGTSAGVIGSCYATGNVTGTGDRIGGLAGNTNNPMISCYATGTVRGSRYVGGLAGYNNNPITSCYATGNVTCLNNYAGGLVGYNYSQGQVSGCYSIGTVTGTSYVGGLCGYTTGQEDEDTGNFWDTETSGIDTSEMGVGKTTAEMQTLSTFTTVGWDFSCAEDPAEWQMSPASYPHAAWEVLPPYCGDTEHPYPTGDLNQDCEVDLDDFAILAVHWMECTTPASD